MPEFGRTFEEEVRRVVRWVWNLPPGGGAGDFIGGEEIDCVCNTPDVVHLVEVTAQRTLHKVECDTASLLKAKRYLENSGNTVKPWIVTLHEPTPDQQAYARNHKVRILSITELKSRVLRAPDYLNARWLFRFGSALDPSTGSHVLGDDEYVPLPLRDARTGDEYTTQRVVQLLVEERKNVILLGPFGAGKSLTVREIFKHLRAKYFKDTDQPIPVAINLRDHWGQDDTDEVLRRHAAKVGFDGRDELVRAWNAGFLVVLLDGFDEVASQAWRIAPADMRNTRHEALRLVRAFVKENQGHFGILFTGRDHYFDSMEEMYRALGLQSTCLTLELGEFTEEQAQRYLKRRGINSPLPKWLPKKPLLLGYLASKNLLHEVLAIEGTKGAAHAWKQFLGKICDREAALSKDIQGESVQRLLEILAQKARATDNGIGPLVESDLASAYRLVTGSEPLEEARMLIQRLPGLTVRDQQEGGRSFVDTDMLDALQGTAIARYIASPFKQPDAENWRHPLRELGHSLAGYLTKDWLLKSSAHLTAAREAVERWNAPTLALDCIVSATHRADVDTFDCEGLIVKQGIADLVDLEHCPLNNFELQWCGIGSLNIGDAHPKGVRLYKCMIERLVGIADSKGIPPWIVECDIGEYDSLSTNAAIMRSQTLLPVRVLLTVLRKLFLQRGRARKESAFFRGLEPGAIRYVVPVLEIIRKSDFAFPIALADGTIWHPNREIQGRVNQIVATLGTNHDPIVLQAARL